MENCSFYHVPLEAQECAKRFSFQLTSSFHWLAKCQPGRGRLICEIHPVVSGWKLAENLPIPLTHNGRPKMINTNCNINVTNCLYVCHMPFMYVIVGQAQLPQGKAVIHLLLWMLPWPSSEGLDFWDYVIIWWQGTIQCIMAAKLSFRKEKICLSFWNFCAHR